MATSTLHIGQFGKDSGHDFEITDTDGGLIQIRYISDGRTAWFQNNRFELTGNGLRLQ